MSDAYSVYCPLSMMHGEPMECVRYDGTGDTCHLCPFDSIDTAARHLDEIGDVLNYPESMFGTSSIAGAIDLVADVLAG